MNVNRYGFFFHGEFQCHISAFNSDEILSNCRSGAVNEKIKNRLLAGNFNFYYYTTNIRSVTVERYNKIESFIFRLFFIKRKLYKKNYIRK